MNLIDMKIINGVNIRGLLTGFIIEKVRTIFEALNGVKAKTRSDISGRALESKKEKIKN